MLTVMVILTWFLVFRPLLRMVSNSIASGGTKNLGDNTFRLHEIDNAPVDLLNGIRVGDIDTDGRSRFRDKYRMV